MWGWRDSSPRSPASDANAAVWKPVCHAAGIGYDVHIHRGEETEGPAWCDWREGRIVVKNPDGAILARMREVASALNARVQGDDGEAYDEALGTPDRAPEKPTGLVRRLFGRG
jgi:hypothetical protein